MGEARFSWQVAYGDVAGGSDVAEPGRPLRDGARGPPGVALGRVRAGRGHDLRPRLPACLDAAGPLAPPAADRAPQPPDEPPPGRAYRLRRRVAGRGGLGVGHPGPRVLAPVDREQDVRVPCLRGGRPSPVHDRQQALPLVTRQGHHVPYACHACHLRGDGGTHLNNSKDYDLTNH